MLVCRGWNEKRKKILEADYASEQVGFFDERRREYYEKHG